MLLNRLLSVTLTSIFTATAFGQVASTPPHMNLRPAAGMERLTAGGAVSASAVRAMERDAFDLINATRADAGLSGLKWSDKIAEVARVHSNNMADLNFFSHRGLDGSMVDDRAARLKMGSWNAIGENIAFLRGFPNPVEIAVEKWLRSPSHKQNLLDPSWTEAAIGLAVTPDGKYYFTQVFIR
jgi:uncharacterized protein YkwD